MPPEAYEQREAEKLAAKINRLFEVVQPPGRGSPYSNEEVSAWLERTSDQGPTISANYLRGLRRASRTNPGVNSLRAIARFFRIEPGFLLNDDERTEEIWGQLDQLQMVMDVQMHGIMTRAANATEQDREWMLSILERLDSRRSDSKPQSGHHGDDT